MTSLPYYMIEFNAISCFFEIRVNDNPVFSLTLESQQMSTNIPLNHGIDTSGPVRVSIKVLPISGEKSLRVETVFDYKIHLYDVAHDQFIFKETLYNYNSPKIDKENPEILLANDSIINALVPYELNTLWKQGKAISKVNDARELLKKEYEKIAYLISNKKFDTYEKMIDLREKNIASSMYLSNMESKNRFTRLIKDFNNGFDKVEFFEPLLLITSAYDRKAALRRPNGDPALSFVNKEIGEQQMLDIEFYYDKKENQFKII